MDADVLVVGGGPAGRALAAAAALRGLRTLLLDPAPDAPWRATYACWAGELPPGLPPEVVASRSAGRAIAHTTHDLGDDYVVLDVAGLRTHLDDTLHRAGGEIRRGRAAPAGPDAVRPADGTVLRSAVVVDVGGHRQPLRTRRAIGPSAEQTAAGVVVDAATAAPLLGSGQALFMDWRPDHGEPGPPTFLYAVPLGGDAVLLEETSLAARPGLGLPVLRRRLRTRLAHHGVHPPPGARTEAVRFPLDLRRHDTPGVLGFGAAAPLTHPATGFGVAQALRLAPAVAEAVAAHLPDAPAARRAASAVLWPPGARLVHRLRRFGLETLVALPSAEVPRFFEVFFRLGEEHRRSYLTERADPLATMAAMAALWWRADRRLRRHLITPRSLPGRV